MLSSLPVGRVNDILRRMEDNISQPDAVKTCFGILAIMSREETNRSLIAKEGMDAILNAMTSNIDKLDVQEAGCDLLWGLAFNNFSIKEVIAKSGGSSVIVRALKRHNRSADYLKSACGALSNMCQCKLNQDGVASQGGLQPLVGSIHTHHSNAKLLPFIFDAVASLIVGHEENARSVSALGFIPLVISSLSRHKVVMEVVKSGCHALAILSDVKGQASKIAFAGGVPVVLSLLDAHPAYADLHRVAAVVLLRMLQESNHVSREITCHEGVRILLRSLEKGGAQHDTVAAVTHILFTITNPSSPASSAIETQLWVTSRSGNDSPSVDESRSKGTSKSMTNVPIKVDGLVPISQKLTSFKVIDSQPAASSGSNTKSTLVGLVHVLSTYPERRDVVRATCRLLNNLCSFTGVINALDRLSIIDKLLDCVNIHRETRDIVDSTTSIIKAINRRAIPALRSNHTGTLSGLIYLYRSKHHDEEAMLSFADLLSKHLENVVITEEFASMDPIVLSTGHEWCHEASLLTVEAINKFVGAEADLDVDEKLGSHWSKHTGRMLHSFLAYFEMLKKYSKLSIEDSHHQDVIAAVNSLMKVLPESSSDITARCQSLIALLSPKVMMEMNAAESENSGKSSDSSSLVAVDSHVVDSPVPNVRKSSDQSEIRNSSSSSNYSNISNLHLSKNLLAIAGQTVQNEHQSQHNAHAQASNVWTSGGSMQYSDGHGDNNSSINSSNHNNNSNGNININRSFMMMKNATVEGDVLKGEKSCTTRLLDNWPNYLERMLTPPNNNMSATQGPSRAYSFDGQTGFLVPSRMSLVYECKQPAGKDIVSKVPTPVPYEVPEEGLGEPFEHSLTFDSEFESGNLLRAVQRGDTAYDLFLRADLHTTGHTQWFYFAVSNTHPPALVKLAQQGVQVPPVRVRFNIVNLTKPDSLFNLGMRPVVYSFSEAATRGIGWVRAGSDISYYVNSFERLNPAGEGINSYFTLSFTIEFTIPMDTVLIAYSYPFTMTDYRSHINQIMSRPKITNICRQFKLCTTLAGDDCDILIITSYADKDRIGPLNGVDDSTTKKGKASRSYKPALFFSGRVHPGEPPASWMMKGILDFLTSDSPAALLLRQAYVIFVVPVLNPDGVVFGNNRCSLAGVDLNRQWKMPMKGNHPTIYHLKALMMAQRRIRDVYMYVDLHGHSRKYNVFMYGCDDKKRPKPQVRAFPRVVSMHPVGRKYVSYEDCSFHIKKGRESTARVVVARELNIPLSFTLEATFCGSNYGPLKHCHMNIGHLQEVGAVMCDAILSFSISDGQTKDVVLVPNGMVKIRTAEEESNSDDLDEEFAMLRTSNPKSNVVHTTALSTHADDDKTALEAPVEESVIAQEIVIDAAVIDVDTVDRHTPQEVEIDSDSDEDVSPIADDVQEEDSAPMLANNGSFPDLTSLSSTQSMSNQSVTVPGSNPILFRTSGIAFAGATGSSANLMPMPPAVTSSRGPTGSSVSVRVLTPSRIGQSGSSLADSEFESAASCNPPDSGRHSAPDETMIQSISGKPSHRKKKVSNGKQKSSKAASLQGEDDQIQSRNTAVSRLNSKDKDSDSEDPFEDASTAKPRKQSSESVAGTKSSKNGKEKSMFPKVNQAQQRS